MGTVYSFLKNRALTLLPAPILRPLKKWHYGRVLRSFTDAEEPDLKVVRHLVQCGTTAVDIGANIGIYTRALADLVSPAGRVISVEPIPQTFEILSGNVQFFGMTNVSCVSVAVSDTDGEATMRLPHYQSGGTNFYQAHVIAARDKTSASSKLQVQVRTIRLDTLLADTASIGFVKCDVEGHELACLSGATMILHAHSPAWLVEVSGNPDQPGTNAMRLFHLFERHSYMAWWFDGYKLLERRHGDTSTNYFFLKSAHLTLLRENAPQLFEGAHPSRL
jgi:FkbM family methyltransferase